MYNTTLNLFSRFALYPILDLKEKLSKEELYNEIKINKIIKHNRRIIRRFNIIAMPLLAGIYLNGLNRINEKLDSVEMTLGSNKETTTPTAPSAFEKEQSIIPLINLKKLEWIKKKIISNKIISIFLLSVLISLIYVFHVEILGLFIFLISDNNILYLKYFILFWLIFWNVINFIELCIYSLKSVNKFNNPNYLPKLILRWLEDMDDDIKLKFQGEIILSYIKSIVFYFIITIIYFFIFI
nr:hypothetical protein [Lentinula edodes]